MIPIFKKRGVIAILLMSVLILFLVLLIWLPQRRRKLSDVVDITCTRTCIYGIEPDRTTAQDAYEKLSYVTVPWQKIILVGGSPISSNLQLNTTKTNGRIKWGRQVFMPSLDPMESDFDYIDFEAKDGVAKTTIITVHANRTNSIRMKDFVSNFGQPSHIWPFATSMPTPDGLNIGVGAWLIYRDRGFAFALLPVAVSKKLELLNDDAEVALFTAYTLDYNPRLDFDPQAAPQWTGSRDITEYCSKLLNKVDGC